ncbi:MAG TPA: aldehyde ferredoxin oxidoreductase [Firmicutes bacterium]|nr:aldehyde ferredoxin oxidoreductase [Bacillota bacterium]
MKILRVNMTTLTTTWEELPGKWRMLGNRALNAKILLKEVDPACEPLGRYNKLVFSCGPLAATNISSSGRLSVGAKSPLTGGIKESNAGGTGGRYLARQGIRAVIVEGKPREEGPYVLYIGDGGAKIHPAVDLEGLGNYRTAQVLRERYGHDASVICIGQAGEMGMAAAGVFNTDMEGQPGRAAGRGGLGAVMGSKGLKAVVIAKDGSYRQPVADPAAFQALRKELHGMILSSPATGKRYPQYGTAGLIPSISVRGAMPTNNFRSGSFAAAEAISGEALYQLITGRGGEGRTTHACMPGCLIRCSNIVPDREGKAFLSPLEYETLAMVGSNLGIGDLETIVAINRRCNDYGLDTIEIGVAVGIAMERGLLAFGDGEGVLKLLDEIAAGTVLGRVLGQGAVITGRVLGAARIPAVKGQGIPAHEPRALKGMSVTYAMSPMGADHTAGVTTGARVEHTNPDGQMELSRTLQVQAAALDALGLCMFVSRVEGDVFPVIEKILTAVSGDTGFDCLSLGKDVIKTERLFNLGAGFTPAHDRVPEFMREEPLPPTNAVSDIPREDYERFWDEEFWGPLDEIWD